MLKTLMLGMVEGERQPGRPARRWIDDVLMWCDKDIKVAVMVTKNWDNCHGEDSCLSASSYGPRDQVFEEEEKEEEEEE